VFPFEHVLIGRIETGRIFVKNWIELAQDGVQWRALVQIPLQLQVLDQLDVNCSRKTVLRSSWLLCFVRRADRSSLN
jgi:hypothetical protein